MKDQNVFDPIRSLSTREGGWLLVLILQGIYLTLDVAEASSERISFGIAASLFMGLLGALIVFYAIRDYHKKKVLEGLTEGIFYIFFATIILYFKHKRYIEHQEVKQDLRQQTFQNELLQTRLQSLNRSLSLISKNTSDKIN